MTIHGRIFVVPDFDIRISTCSISISQENSEILSFRRFLSFILAAFANGTILMVNQW